MLILMNLLKEYQSEQKSSELMEFTIQYMALGLGGEVGEVQNEIKKLFRDDDNKLNDVRRKRIMSELGDVMWYLTGICRRVDCNLEDIIKLNIDKLNK